MSNWRVRLAALFLLLTTAWYLPWALGHLNWGALWLSLPFAAATVLVAVMTLITALDHWRYATPPEHRVPEGEEPQVLVIIPTCGEPVEMVYATAQSVLAQDYPIDRIRLIVSDDAHSPAIKEMVLRLNQEHPRAHGIAYHEPPRKGDPARKGEAKAGNLNSALALVQGHAGDYPFVETRDADDLVGDRSFLRQAIGQLQSDPRIAFVQTIKECITSPGDPFGNAEPLFYRRAMLAKHAANAVFPCGSGLVWRHDALRDIGGFPTWNLVEDLYSGVLALRRGWRGVYLPIVGATGQTAPEDLPNAIKQRGTWAIDTMRMTVWGAKRGLSLRQNVQFAELGFFYMLSFAVLVFGIVPAISLVLDVYPLVTDHAAYALHFWPYAAAVELLLAALAQGLPYEDLWRSRQIWLGMAPVYAYAAVVAVLYGPHRKPVYRVTRKVHHFAWHWREGLPQVALLVALVGAIGYHVATHSLVMTADLGSLFWALFYVLCLVRTIRNSWHGVGGNAKRKSQTAIDGAGGA